MPKSALPDGFAETAAGTGTDWDNSLQRWIKKSWFAYGPRATQWWAKWREIPMPLLAIFGPGFSRWETSGGELALRAPNDTLLFYTRPALVLSVIQYWAKWSFQIQWPFFIAFHCYIDAMPAYPAKAGDRRVLYFRFGARRDADKVYWFPSFFIGLQWN